MEGRREGAEGTIPKSYLGIASGILATMRNVVMVLGIAIGGAVLYAFSPNIMQNAVHESRETNMFLPGLQHT